MNSDSFKRTAAITVALFAVAIVPFLHAGEREIAPSQKIAELEKTIVVLRSDNAALRAQLAALTTKQSQAIPRPRPTDGASPSVTAASQSDPADAHWISGTGKRHNKNCRYFGTGRGHPCGPYDGVACKICGG